MTTFEQSRPSLEVGDLGAALAFLTDVVGFTANVVEGEPPIFAMIGDGPAQIALVEVDHPAIPEGAACYVTVTDLGGVIERIASAGIELDLPLTDRRWGMRDIVVSIPGDGPRIAFGERIP